MHATLSDFIAETVQNAIEAGAAAICLDVVENEKAIEVMVADNGPGMSGQMLAEVFDPFSGWSTKHPRRRVALGLPGLRQAVEQAGGKMEIRSAPGRGTSVWFRFPKDHPDTPPMGDWVGTLMGLMTFPGDYELRVSRARNGSTYALSRSELQAAFDGLENVAGLMRAKALVEELEQNLEKGSQHGEVDVG